MKRTNHHLFRYLFVIVFARQKKQRIHPDNRMPALSLELEHTLGFTPNIQGLAFHPAVHRSAIFYSCGRLLVESDLDDCHRQRILRGHDAVVSCIDVSRSGTMIGSGQHVSADGHCYFNVWDYETGTVRLRVPTPHKSRVEAIKFSPDDMLIATTGAEGALCIFDTTSGKCIASFQDTINGDAARSIRWGTVADSGTRYQRYSLFVPFNTGVRLFALSFSIQKLSFELQCTACQVPGGGGRLGGYVRHFLCCTTLGENILCGATTGDLMVFNSETGLYRSALSLNANGVSAVVAIEDRNCAFVGGGDGKVKKVSGSNADWKLYGEVTLEGAVTSMDVSGDGAQLIIATTAGYVYRMLTDDMTFTIAVESPLRGINDVAVCQQAPELFVTASNDGFIRLWNLNDYSIQSKFSLGVGPQRTHVSQPPEASGPTVVPTSCTFDVSVNTVVAGFSDGRLRCVDLSRRQGAVVWATAGGHKGKVHTVRVCSQYMVTAGDDSVVRVWSRQTRELIAQMQDHKLATTTVLIDNTTSAILHSFSMDMSHAAYDLSRLGNVASAPRRVGMHNVASTGGFLCATQRIDNEHEVIVGTADGRLLFFDLDVPQSAVLEVPDQQRVRVTSCECSPNGAMLAVGLGDGTLKLFRLGVSAAPSGTSARRNTCELLVHTPCHSTAVSKCLWTVDGKQLISSTSDGDLIVWNVFAAA